MTNKKINFAIDKFELIKDSENSQLAKLKVFVCREGNNLHNLPISWGTIKMAANTLVGKPILVNYIEAKNDFGGHDITESPVGCFIRESDLGEETDSDGNRWLTSIGYIWKKYFPAVFNVLEKNNNETSVSMEIELLGDDNDNSINTFSFMGLTLLGRDIQPAIPNAKALLSFSSMLKETEEIIAKKDFSSKYEDIDFTIPDSIKKNSKKGLNLYNSKKTGGNGFLLSVARYITNNVEIEPSRVKKIYKALISKSKQDLNKDGDNYISFMLLGGKECMKFCEGLINFMEDSDKTQLSHFTFNADDKGIETEESLKKKIVQMEAPEEEKPVEEKMAEEEAPAEAKEEEKQEEKMSETPEEEKSEPAEEEAKETPEEESKEGEEEVSMSLDMYADVSALMALLGNETEEYKSMSAEFAKPEKDFAKISEGLYFLCKKYAEKCMSIEEENKSKEEKMSALEKFKADAEEKEFKNKVYSILEEVKPFVSETELTAMKENSANFSIDTIVSWEKEVKASLFTSLSKKVNEEKHDDIVKMQLPFNDVKSNNQKYIW